VDIDADEFLGFETPREIGEHIIEANDGEATPVGTPEPGPDPEGTSTSDDDDDGSSSSAEADAANPDEADESTSF
jgi:hypothetical protein